MSSVLRWILKLAIWGGLTYAILVGLYILAAKYGFLGWMPITDLEIIIAMVLIGAALAIVLGLVKLVWAIFVGVAQGVREGMKGADRS